MLTALLSLALAIPSSPSKVSSGSYESIVVPARGSREVVLTDFSASAGGRSRGG